MSSPPSEVSDRSLVVRDGRTVAWTECGPPDGTVVVRMSGTPGCRWSVRGDRAPWDTRRLRMITTERPGFGASTRLQGRGFAEHAADVAEILDHLGLDAVHLLGDSGGAPHVLAFAAQNPTRVRAATVVSGAAPMTDAEAATMIPLNVRGRRLARHGDADAVRALLEPIRAGLMTDPLAGYQAVMAQSPPADQLLLIDPQWQVATARATREALGDGVEGWVDETLAVFGDWTDIALDHVVSSLTWWHAAGDRNAPSTAAQRLVDALPSATLHVWPDEGHFTAYHREGEVLDELLARA